MPLHDVGYRSWEGKRTSLFGRWSVVAKTGSVSRVPIHLA